MVAPPPPNFRGVLTISDQNNWGGDLGKKLNLFGGELNFRVNVKVNYYQCVKG